MLGDISAIPAARPQVRCPPDAAIVVAVRLDAVTLAVAAPVDGEGRLGTAARRALLDRGLRVEGVTIIPYGPSAIAPTVDPNNMVAASSVFMAPYPCLWAGIQQI
jgi:hypothetical protein